MSNCKNNDVRTERLSNSPVTVCSVSLLCSRQHIIPLLGTARQFVFATENRDVIMDESTKKGSVVLVITFSENILRQIVLVSIHQTRLLRYVIDFYCKTERSTFPALKEFPSRKLN
jgi:hypothetical protein